MIHDTPDREPPFSLSYLSKSEFKNGELTCEQYLEQISRARKTDLIRRTTSVGPHLDDLRFDFAGNLAADHASQGQIRAMILGLT